MANQPTFLGKGWQFPPEFGENGQEVKTVSGADDVQQAIEILLGTRLEERVMQESFGCNLSDFVFEEMSIGLLNDIRDVVTDAILFHEPRVEVNDIQLSTDDQVFGRLLIHIDYTIPASNTRFNMVYPFYLQEANV